MERSTIYCQYPVLNRSQWGWKYSNTSGMLEAERNKTWRNHFCWHSICNRRNMSCFIHFPENSTTPHWWISNLNCQTDQCISLVQTKFTRPWGSYRNCFRNAKEFWYLVLGRTHHLQSYYDSGTSLKSIATTHSFRRSHMFFFRAHPPLNRQDFLRRLLLRGCRLVFLSFIVPRPRAVLHISLGRSQSYAWNIPGGIFPGKWWWWWWWWW